MTRKILVVEDDTLVAMMLDGYLDALGYETVGPSETVAAALAHVGQSRFDAAIVDVHLANGETSGPVVEALAAAAIPFIITTGAHNIVSDPRFDGAPILTKPFTLNTLEVALNDLR